MSIISPQLKSKIKAEVDSADHGERSVIVKRWAESITNPNTGNPVSPATVWRAIDVTNGTKKCEREPEVPQEYINIIGKIKLGGYNYGPKGRMLTTEDAIEEAELLGLVPEGVITVATADRRLREAGWNKKRTYEMHEDEYVNQVHQLDFSRSEYFEVGEGENGELIIKVDGRNQSWDYKNKPKEERFRLWIATVVDSYSRTMIARFIPATGENLQMAADALGFFWQRKDSNHPMLHLPEVLKTDQGSIGKFLKYHNHFSKATGIRIELSGSKSNRLAEHQSQGKVERRFRTLWQRFELKMVSRLKKMGIEEIQLEDLNVLVHEYCVELLEKKHPLRSQAIGELYLSGLRMNEQRKLNTDINDLLFTENTRKVSSTKVVSIDKILYRVPDKYAYQRIKVFRTADGDWYGTSIDGNDSFDLIEFDPDNTQAKKLHDPTFREQLAEEPLEFEKPQKMSLVGKEKQTGSAPQPHTLPHAEQDVEAETPFQAKPVKHAFTDWNKAKMCICQVFNCRWADLSEQAQDVFYELYEAKKLTESMIKELQQTAS